MRSTYGRGFIAVKDDEIAAEAMGINTTKFKVIAFIAGAFFAGVAGGLYSHFIQYILIPKILISPFNRICNGFRRHGQYNGIFLQL
jgi:ABC-type branched-subunit amino acid transport system permease subunit